MNENKMTELTPAAFPATEVIEHEGKNYVANLTTATVAFSSMNATSIEDKKRLYNAMNSPDGRIKDMVNMRIAIQDIYCEMVQCTSEETGEISNVPRIVLIDVDGKSYQAVSMGIYNAVRKLIQVFGVPTWDGGLEVEVKQISKGNRSILTLNIV